MVADASYAPINREVVRVPAHHIDRLVWQEGHRHYDSSQQPIARNTMAHRAANMMVPAQGSSQETGGTGTGNGWFKGKADEEEFQFDLFVIFTGILQVDRLLSLLLSSSNSLSLLLSHLRLLSLLSPLHTHCRSYSHSYFTLLPLENTRTENDGLLLVAG